MDNPAAAHRPRQAFTLIELLVVMMIIAILMGLLLPMIRLVKEMARGTSCQSRQRQIGMFITNYVGENSGLLPAAGAGYPGYWYHLITGETGLSPVPPESAVFMCSEDRHRAGDIASPGSPNPAWRDGWISQGYNVQGLGGTGGPWFSTDTSHGSYASAAVLGQVAKPSMTVLVCDVLANNNAAMAAAGWGYHQVAGNATPQAYPRHSGKRVCNVLWADIHVSGVAARKPGDWSSLYEATSLGLHPRDAAIDSLWDRR